MELPKCLQSEGGAVNYAYPYNGPAQPLRMRYSGRSDQGRGFRMDGWMLPGEGGSDRVSTGPHGRDMHGLVCASATKGFILGKLEFTSSWFSRPL